jgi:hypothetical protein
MRTSAFFLVAALTLTTRAQGQLPAGWQSRLFNGTTDGVGQVSTTPAGYQVKTTDAGLWWDPSMVEKKSFAVVLEGDFLPASAVNAFGVFVGGRDLDNPKASFLSFQVKGDGTYLLELRDGPRIHALAPWMPHRAITKAMEGMPTHYNVRFEIRPLRIDMIVNNIKVHTIDRATVRADGQVGLRLDAGLDMTFSKVAVEPIP